VKSFVLSACIFLIPVCLLASGPRNSKDPGAQSRPPSTATQPSTSSDPGERVFTANCARCHTPPMALRPRITGTVIMHMRVRARLSKDDEKLLLRFMAP
jgi:cytochrome c5